MIFSANCKFSDLKLDIVNSLPCFYQELLKCFFQGKGLTEELNINDVIWNNKCIMYKNRVLFFPNWVKAGLLYVKQVTGQDGQILPYDIVKAMLPVHPSYLMQYNALRLALLSVNVCTDANVQEGVLQNVLEVQAKAGERIQQCFYVKPISQHFWERKFPEFHFDWEYIWSLAPKVCKEPRIITQQWKLLNNIYPTNILLKKMGKVPSENCKYCGLKDFIEHFFVTCKEVKQLWTLIESYVKIKHNTVVVLNECVVLFGYRSSVTKKDIENDINKLLLVAKLCISKFKYGDYCNLRILFERECAHRKMMLN